LRRDVRGNTLAIMAASMIPLVAMIGSGVDMTRAYMAQNRFRQACDAGALAGRKLLSGTTVSDPVRTEATKYFRFNFPIGHFQSAAYTLAMSVPATGTLKITSETTIETTIMKMFGFQTLPITAVCSATQDFVNTDIMMVFDLSGSMNCLPGVAGGCASGIAGSKLDALKSAAKSLYTTLEPAQNQLNANSLRLRYGFVNYSSNVNVGAAVYAKNPSYFASKWTYQSRTLGYTTTGKSKVWCDARNGVHSSYNWWGGTATFCTYADPASSDWVWIPVEHDVTSYLAGGTPYLASIKRNSTAWRGCVEERRTNNVAIDGGTSVTAPADAWDLNVDRLPDNDDTRWGPVWPDTVFKRNESASEVASCATAARRLQNYYNNKAGFDSYVDGLTAEGSTYHDIGMIWGARFISPTGIFAASPSETNDLSVEDNPLKLRGFGVKRYIIFMTDGDMAPSDTYSAYGIESLDNRVTGAASNQLNRHLQRFRMACNAAKAKGIDVWVIAFATTLTTDMERCASKPEQAAGLSTNAALIAKFEEIGSKIGSLRLSQ
jgi:hypothetical protein